MKVPPRVRGLELHYLVLAPEKADAKPRAMRAPPEILRWARRRRKLDENGRLQYRQQGPDRIAAPTHQGKQDSHSKICRLGVQGRVNELRQKSEENSAVWG